MEASLWQPLALLRQQFESNLESLAQRNAHLAGQIARVEPAQAWFLAPLREQVALGQQQAGQVVALPNPVPPAAARQIAMKLFPGGKCAEPVLVAGLDQGWLWNVLYQMDISTPRTPGHRPPLYLLARDVERLWAVLHVHDWKALLRDRRVHIFTGDDCVQQFQQSMIENTLSPWPRLSVTVDPSIWPAGMSIDALINTANQHATERLNQLIKQVNGYDASVDPIKLSDRLLRDKLRILGITSRFTTFLQYSMRDWLAACEQLGHETRLLIEQHDHEIANPLHFADVCADFRPDLILMIDHYRGEFSGLPQNVPCVMWVQDRLPNIFRPAAGAAQKRADYVLGYGRQECIVSHGYPRERFMPAMVGFNENRFAARELSADELERYACDVSFVSHASTPPEVLVQREIDKTPLPEGKRFLADVLERFRAIYDAGGFVSEGGQIRRIIRESMGSCGIETSDLSGLLDFFIQKVNNAFFRQQAIAWLSEMDVNLHLWGRGWEEHPRFKRFARGIADNEKQLGAIHQASRINFQVTPFGAIHQRLFDGLSAGGFFLLRHCTGDECDPLYRKMWQWCEEAGIRSGPQFFAQAPEHVREMIAKITQLTAEDPSTIADTFFLGLEEAAAAGFTRSAATLFAEYKGISFRSREELQRRVGYFLANPEHRRQIAQSMRARVIDSMTYKAITSRLLRFISDDLSALSAPRVAA